jgi:hypothetical protein
MGSVVSDAIATSSVHAGPCRRGGLNFKGSRIGEQDTPPVGPISAQSSFQANGVVFGGRVRPNMSLNQVSVKAGQTLSI